VGFSLISFRAKNFYRTAILYFEDPTLFDEKKMQRSLNFFRYHRENDGTLTEKFVKHVYCVIKGEKEIKIYDV